MNGHRSARFLGWFSVGLGLAEIAAPRTLAQILGTRPRPALTRTAYGLREVAVGVGILASRNPRPWVWARVAGDALDLATLSAIRSGRRGRPYTAALALGSVAAVTALDVRTALALGDGGDADRGGVPDGAETVRGSVVVDRPPDEVFWAWRDPVTVATMLSPFLEVRAESPELAHLRLKTRSARGSAGRGTSPTSGRASSCGSGRSPTQPSATRGPPRSDRSATGAGRGSTSRAGTSPRAGGSGRP